MKNANKRIIASNRGNTVPEYALLCSVMCLFCISATSILGAESEHSFSKVALAIEFGGGSHGSGTGDDNKGFVRPPGNPRGPGPSDEATGTENQISRQALERSNK